MDTKTKECINKLFILRTSSFLCSSLIRRFEIDSISPSHKTTILSFVSLICTWTQFVSTLTDSNLTLNQEHRNLFLFFVATLTYIVSTKANKMWIVKSRCDDESGYRITMSKSDNSNFDNSNETKVEQLKTMG